MTVVPVADPGRPIRWGICGTGVIARRFVTEIAEVASAVVVAVGSDDAARAAAFAGSFGIARSYGSHDELAADPEVDVVYVASTQDRHLRDVLLFVGSGRHVLCEKPFALSIDDARTMCDAATAADVLLMEALWSRFLPSYVDLAQLVADGAIGVPQLVEANFAFSVPTDLRATHRLFDPARGGGALFDLGVYPVQLAHLVFGAPDTVAATARFGDRGIDEQTAVLLGWTSGGAALLHAAIATTGNCAARIVGTDGTIELRPPMHCPTELVLERGGEREVRTYDAPSLHHQVVEVHRCLRAGERQSPLMPHAETLAIMSTLDTVRRHIGLTFDA